MYERRLVVVEDIETDPLWADYRHLALPIGLRACWSVPFENDAGVVLGAFAVYYRTSRRPSRRRRSHAARHRQQRRSRGSPGRHGAAPRAQRGASPAGGRSSAAKASSCSRATAWCWPAIRARNACCARRRRSSAASIRHGDGARVSRRRLARHRGRPPDHAGAGIRQTDARRHDRAGIDRRRHRLDH